MAAAPRETTTVAERAIEDGLVKPLGEGGFGAVWLWRGPSGEMAVKIVLKKTGKKHRNVNILTQTRTEASTMSVLKHPHIVGLHHFLETETSLYLCLQLCKGGDLLDLINSAGKLPQGTAKVYFRQLMEAVKYVHDAGYIHRDIKCENIFLSETRQEIFLGDFGLSGTWTAGKTQKLSWGSPHYASPEISTGSPYIGPEVDVWSCGVVLYAMVMAALPFTGPTDADVIESVTSGEYKPVTSCAPARNLIERLLVVDATKRASVATILQHPWIARAPVTLQRVSSDPERISSVASLTRVAQAQPAATSKAGAAVDAKAPAGPATTTTQTAPVAPTATATASAAAPAVVAALATVGRTAMDQEREMRVRGSSIIGKRPAAAPAKPAAAKAAGQATAIVAPVPVHAAAAPLSASATGVKGAVVMHDHELPPSNPSGSIISRPPQTKGGSGSRVGGMRLNRRPSLPEAPTSSAGSRLLESQRRTEFKHLGLSLRQSRRNLQALKAAASDPAQHVQRPASADPSGERLGASLLTPSVPIPALAPISAPQAKIAVLPLQNNLENSRGKDRKDKKKKEKRSSEEGAQPDGKVPRNRSRSLDQVSWWTALRTPQSTSLEPYTEEEKLLWEIQKEAPHSEQVANLYLQLIRRIVADPSLSLARLPAKRRPPPAAPSPHAAPSPRTTEPAATQVPETPSTIGFSGRFVKAAYLLMRKSSALLRPITASKFKSRLCCLTTDGSLQCFRTLEEQAAGIAVETITDLATCEIVIEPMMDQLWPFTVRTAKQHFSFAVQTEEERSSWAVDILKLRPLAALMELLADAAVGRFAATAACVQAVEVPECTASVLNGGVHSQLYHFIEANTPKMEASVSSALIDAFTAMICKMSLLPDAASRLQFVIPLLLRNLADTNEKRSSLALQTLQNFYSEPAFVNEIRRLNGAPRLLEVLSELLEGSGQQGIELSGGDSGSGNRLMLEKDGLVNKLASPQRNFRPTSGATLSVDQWRALIAHFKEPVLGVPVRDRTWRLTNYPCCFVGSQAVDWLIVHKYAKSREDAVAIGARLLSAGEFSHVVNEHPFKDAKLFYRFADASATLKARKLQKAVATQRGRQVEMSIEDLLAEFDPIESALLILGNCAADPQVQTQLGERMMMSVVPILSAVFARKQANLTLAMLQLIERCCKSEFCWRGLRAAGLLFDVLREDPPSPQEALAQLKPKIESAKEELAEQRRSSGRTSRSPKPAGTIGLL